MDDKVDDAPIPGAVPMPEFAVCDRIGREGPTQPDFNSEATQLMQRSRTGGSEGCVSRISSISRPECSSSLEQSRPGCMDKEVRSTPDVLGRSMAISTMDLPSLDDYAERTQASHRHSQVLVANVAEAASREVKASVEACMATFESKLIADACHASARAVTDHMEKFIPELVKELRREEIAMIDSMAALTSLLQAVISQGQGASSGFSTGGCAAAITSLSFASRAWGRLDSRPCMKQRSFSQSMSFKNSENNSSSDRSIKTLEQELAHQVLEDSGIRHTSRSSTNKSSCSSLRSRRPSDACVPVFSEVSSLANLACVLPVDQVSACVPASSPPALAEEAASLPGSSAILSAAAPHIEPKQLSGLAPPRQTGLAPPRQITPEEEQISIQRMDEEDRLSTPTQRSSAEAQESEVAAGDDEMPTKDASMVLRPSMSKEGMTTRQIRRVRINELVEGVSSGFNASQSSQDTDNDLSEACWDVFSPVVFRVCGIIPWTSARPAFSSSYQMALWLTTFAACSCIIAQFIERMGGHGRVCPGVGLDPVCLDPTDPLSELPLAIGAVVGLALLSRCGCRDSLSDDLFLLKVYAFKQEFMARWERRLFVDQGFVVVAWLLANASQSGDIFVGGLQNASSMDVAQAIAFAIVSGILLGLVFCMLYVCRALTLMVDTFCSRVVDGPDFTMTIEEWNVLQAVLRKASAAIEYCFIALQAVMAFTMPLLLADFYLLGASRSTLCKLLPSAFTMLGVLRMFALASMITDKCTRVPSLINSLPLGEGTARERQHIVDYIVSSAAGFYVCDVQLNMSLALKFMYGWSVVACGLITLLFSTE